jgi:uncharacterized protein YyaL (SSP411 family)
MAHESFEDAATAAVMNELFVNIKVDREERPDLDRIYQIAQQMLMQRGGGWPLTMFLSPQDQRPFFGGTYFPNTPRYGMPAFAELLRRVAEFYHTRKTDIAQQGEALQAAFAELSPSPASPSTALTLEPIDRARERLAGNFDARYGGFGGAPKFPHPGNIDLLLRCWRTSAAGEQPDLHSLYMATLTLTRMAEGGIFDQLAGGFSRYSVDEYWMIPHFEKMLYDNAQLLRVYSQAAVATGESLFRRAANETADFLIRDMRSPEGAFWSTLDADSEGHEGKFYVWDAAEVRNLLPADAYDMFAARFGLDRAANFEGLWHLHVYRSHEEVANDLGLAREVVEKRIDESRVTLLAARERRIHPGRDEKILTSWNGLAVAAFCVASRALARGDLAAVAMSAVDFIRDRLWHNGRLLAVSMQAQARFPAYLDDYAFLLDGLIELLQTHWRTADLDFAIALAEVLLNHFEDRVAGGFFFTADDHESLIHRSKSFADEAVPSGNAVAARTLTHLGLLLGETRYLDAAARTIRAGWSGIEQYPHGHAAMLIALEEHLEPPSIVVIRGRAAEVEPWRAELARAYAPHRLVFAIPSDVGQLPAGLEQKAVLAETVAYICKGMTCSEPIRSLEGLARLSS